MAVEESSHWVERLAEEIMAKKKEPYIINSGMTPSGTVHLGTLCEFTYPAAIQDFLAKKGKATFYLEIDNMDAFDGVPSAFSKYEKELTPHLGKPLCRVPDLEGCCKSFAEHFMNEIKAVMQDLGVAPVVLTADELYAQGKYDRYALLFFEKLEDVKRAVYESSLRQELPGWWSPVMPICAKCGRIATTRVTAFEPNGNDARYDYACDRILKYTKGCGHVGSGNISDHEYKITWRLDWPARQDFLNVSAEGAGVDHATRGGSQDTAEAVHRKIFQKEPPAKYRYGFVLFEGKKYSKSKGVGLGVKELLELVPPEVIKYALLRPDVEENKDMATDGESMLRLCEDYIYASLLGDGSGRGASVGKTENKSEAQLRADRKKQVAFQLASGGKREFTNFSDVLLYYQLYRDWKKVEEMLGPDAKSARYLRPYVENWVAKGFTPEEYAFSYEPKEVHGNRELVKEFAERLDGKMNALDVHNLVFDLAKERGEKPQVFFESLYMTLINKPKGPKMGRLVEAVGVLKVKNTLLELLSKAQ